jgi:hypothetical protein
MRTPDIERLTGSSDESVANSRAASPDDDMLGPTAAGEVSYCLFVSKGHGLFMHMPRPDVEDCQFGACGLVLWRGWMQRRTCE